MFRPSKGDVTYLPEYYRLTNKLVKQASDTMYHMNPLLDKFLTYIKRKTQTISSKRKRESNPAVYEEPDFKRHCKLSIVTLGTSHTRSHGFSNEPHVDVNDSIADKEFQDFCFKTLNKWRKKYNGNYEISKHIVYLLNLHKVCNGFQVPTTCGYRLFSDENDDALHANFTMEGINSSIRIMDGMYHSFFGNACTHNTAVPIVQRNNQFFIYNKESSSNVAAWGASSATSRNKKVKRLT
jgi:hypothetical protein